MANRLANTQSLYLRKHAENPIDWWPWCDDAIATARRDDKPIFLSIGYSSCHWCTVMEGEAFSDDRVAQYLNANFLPIKVDREERPDLDSIYMQALQMMVGQGGWPLNIFLLPEDLVPFYGGTYFPLQPRYGRPGFLEVLQKLRQYYDIEKEKLQGIRDEMLATLQQSAAIAVASPETMPLDGSLLLRGLETSTAIISGGGFGNSFPMIPYATVALQATLYNYESKHDPRQVAERRGLDLALGGIFDHVAGGFHRYTVDPTWTVPHFEKMLYDNGQILEYLSDLWAVGIQEPAFDRAVDLTVEWLRREMTAPEGYFYASQDADSFVTGEEREPEEGAFYVWSDAELQSALDGVEYVELQQQFTVSGAGNFEGQNVLQRQEAGEISDTLETALAKLFILRYGAPPEEVKTFPPARNNAEAKQKKWPGRIPAVTDTKGIVSWNAIAISGLARSAAVFGRSSYLELARSAADFILDRQWIDDRLYRVNYEGETSVLAQSEDYALLIKALLDLYEACLAFGDAEAKTYFQKAMDVQAEFDEHLWSIDLGGYFNAASDASGDLIVRERSYMDNATPSANGVAMANLVRLMLLTGNLDYLDRAEAGLKAFAVVMEKSPQACPSLFGALNWYLNATLVRTTTGESAFVQQQYFPTMALVDYPNLPDNSIAMVCRGLACLDPAKDRDRMVAQIQKCQTRSGIAN